MEEQQPVLAPPRLDYATPRTDPRVLYTREADRATVVIHRPERRAQAAWNATGEVLSEAFMYLLIGGVILAFARPLWLVILLPATVALLGLVFGLEWLSRARLARPIVVELTATELIFSNLDDRARPHRLDREGLYAIYYVAHAKSVFVRRRGKEILELHLTPDVAESERIATFLREAVGLAAQAAEEASPTDYP